MKVLLLILMMALRVAAGAEATRFRAVDVFIDSKGEPLAAYQMEITAPTGAKIVGIEGGEHEEFRKAPYYDPKAMQTEKVIVAAFSTAAAAKLPVGKTRVLTLHLEISMPGEPELEVILTVAGKPNGQKIRAGISLQERKQP